MSLSTLGVQKGFNPLDSAYGTLWAWLDASDATTMYVDDGQNLVTADLDPVQRMVCKAGSSAQVSRIDQTSGGKFGTYRTNQQAGKSGLVLDGNDHYAPTASAILGTTFTLYAAVTVTNTASKKFLLGGITEEMAVGFDANEKALIEETDISAGVTAASAASTSLVSLTFDGATATHYLARASNGSGSFSLAVGNGTVLSVFALGIDGTLGLSGTFFEMLIFKQVHSAIQMARAWDYLQTKWGL